MNVRFNWNAGKNTKLKEERGISFEEVSRIILSGNATQRRNPSPKYPGQWVFFVRARGKTWVVPFEEKKTGVIYLFTIFLRKKR